MNISACTKVLLIISLTCLLFPNWLFTFLHAKHLKKYEISLLFLPSMSLLIFLSTNSIVFTKHSEWTFKNVNCFKPSNDLVILRAKPIPFLWSSYTSMQTCMHVCVCACKLRHGSGGQGVEEMNMSFHLWIPRKFCKLSEGFLSYVSQFSLSVTLPGYKETWRLPVIQTFTASAASVSGKGVSILGFRLWPLRQWVWG